MYAIRSYYEYRDIDSATDVLSFEQGDEYIDDEDRTWFNAGDIVISLPALDRNAEDFSVPRDEELKRLIVHGIFRITSYNVCYTKLLREELKRLIVHGILHLDGMDHSDNSPEQEMLQFQEHLLAGFTGDKVCGD